MLAILGIISSYLSWFAVHPASWWRCKFSTDILQLIPLLGRWVPDMWLQWLHVRSEKASRTMFWPTYTLVTSCPHTHFVSQLLHTFSAMPFSGENCNLVFSYWERQLWRPNEQLPQNQGELYLDSNEDLFRHIHLLPFEASLCKFLQSCLVQKTGIKSGFSDVYSVGLLYKCSVGSGRFVTKPTR